MGKKEVETGLKLVNRSLKQTDRQIKSAYGSSLKRIRNELLKLAEKTELTMGQMTKFNRLKKLEKEILTIVSETNREIGKEIRKDRRKGARIGFEANSEGIIQFGKINKNAVTASLDFPLSGQTFGQTMKDLNRSAVLRISRAITQGVIQGQGVVKIAKNIREQLGISMRRAMTISRTETLRAYSVGQLTATDKLIDRGFEVQKIWVHAGPKTTIKGAKGKVFYQPRNHNPDHVAKDEKPANEEGFFVFPDGVEMQAPKTSGVAKHDINCRCVYYNKVLGKTNK
jgi:hypothetical protein